jgi:hypothetical protein
MSDRRFVAAKPIVPNHYGGFNLPQNPSFEPRKDAVTTNQFLREFGRGLHEIGHMINSRSQQPPQTQRVAYGARPFPLEETNLVQAIGGVHGKIMSKVAGVITPRRVV